MSSSSQTSISPASTVETKKHFEYKPNLGDVVQVMLHPGNFFVHNSKDPKDDPTLKVYNEFTREFRKTVYPKGRVIEVFKNRKDRKTWVRIFNHFDGYIYSVPCHNVLQLIK